MSGVDLRLIQLWPVRNAQFGHGEAAVQLGHNPLVFLGTFFIGNGLEIIDIGRRGKGTGNDFQLSQMYRTVRLPDDGLL